MRLRAHRRTLMTSRPPVGPAGSYEVPGFTRLAGTSRIRRCVRIGALLTVIGLMRLARGVRSRWRPLSAAALLTVFGVLLRNGEVLIFAAGLLYMYPLLIRDGSDPDRKRRRYELERELPVYSIPAECHQIVLPP